MKHIPSPQVKVCKFNGRSMGFNVQSLWNKQTYNSDKRVLIKHIIIIYISEIWPFLCNMKHNIWLTAYCHLIYHLRCTTNWHHWGEKLHETNTFHSYTSIKHMKENYTFPCGLLIIYYNLKHFRPEWNSIWIPYDAWGLIHSQFVFVQHYNYSTTI